MSRIDLEPYYVELSMQDDFMNKDSFNWLELENLIATESRPTIVTSWLGKLDSSKCEFYARREVLVLASDGRNLRQYNIGSIVVHKVTEKTVSLYDTDGSHYIARKSDYCDVVYSAIKVDDCYTSVEAAAEQFDRIVRQKFLEHGITDYETVKYPFVLVDRKLRKKEAADS